MISNNGSNLCVHVFYFMFCFICFVLFPCLLPYSLTFHFEVNVIYSRDEESGPDLRRTDIQLFLT